MVLKTTEPYYGTGCLKTARHIEIERFRPNLALASSFKLFRIYSPKFAEI